MTITGDHEDKENQQNNQSVQTEAGEVVELAKAGEVVDLASGGEVIGNRMDHSLSVKRKLFVEVSFVY